MSTAFAAVRSVLATGLIAGALIAAPGVRAQDYGDAPPPPQGYDAGSGYEGQGYGDTDAAAGPDYQPAPVRSVGDFYPRLAPYGRWLETRFGRAWVPNVGPGWRPYTVGRWRYTTNYGYFWDSDEPWGWATYHYGRWGFDPDFGWVWTPGLEWAPAWVSWRYGGGYSGWAPLPPQVPVGYGFAGGDYWADYPAAWVFAPTTYLFAPRLYGYVVPYGRGYGFFGRTRVVGNVAVFNNHYVNRGIAYGEVRRYARDAGPPARLVGQGGRPQFRAAGGGGFGPGGGYSGPGGGRYDGARAGYGRPGFAPAPGTDRGVPYNDPRAGGFGRQGYPGQPNDAQRRAIEAVRGSGTPGGFGRGGVYQPPRGGFNAGGARPGGPPFRPAPAPAPRPAQNHPEHHEHDKH